MKRNDINNKEQTQNSVTQHFRQFCAAYTSEQAQQTLWRWFNLALNDSCNDTSILPGAEQAAFYENIKELLLAVYQLNHLPSEEQSALLPQQTQVLPPTFLLTSHPIAKALDTLHESMATSWVLLISPPSNPPVAARLTQAIRSVS